MEVKDSGNSKNIPMRNVYACAWFDYLNIYVPFNPPGNWWQVVSGLFEQVNRKVRFPYDYGLYIIKVCVINVLHQC